jgi:hypothetical protein
MSGAGEVRYEDQDQKAARIQTSGD